MGMLFYQNRKYIYKKSEYLPGMHKKLNHIFPGGMYGGKNTLIWRGVDRREACSPDVKYNPKSLLFGLRKQPFVLNHHCLGRKAVLPRYHLIWI